MVSELVWQVQPCLVNTRSSIVCRFNLILHKKNRAERLFLQPLMILLFPPETYLRRKPTPTLLGFVLLRLELQVVILVFKVRPGVSVRPED